MAVPVSKSSRKKKKNRIKKNSYIAPINVGVINKVIFNTEVFSQDDKVNNRPYKRMYDNIKTRIPNRNKRVKRRSRIKKKYYYRTK